MAALAARTFALACPPTTTAEAIAEHIRTVLSPARFRAHLADPAHRVVLAEVDGRPVGYTMVVAAPPADPDVAGALRLRPVIELSKVYVEAGQHGVGRRAAAHGGDAADRARRWRASGARRGGGDLARASTSTTRAPSGSTSAAASASSGRGRSGSRTPSRRTT
ncbi:GNAT family N-acetyltransferase [Clavibacter zhangzhiyongii]|uniref:GNAT family N-acetyltransferase n=1 Tax=Clavibacter zhangzhiyongii TaxID=2768071 RepID=UPI0039E02FFC